MTSSPPDISTLSLNSRPSQQRLHDIYDYEGNISGNGNGRPQYHFSTSPPVPAQSQYNQLGMSQSPLKSKPIRGGLPTVRRPFLFLFVNLHRGSCGSNNLFFHTSNGWTTLLLRPTIDHYRRTIILTFHLLEARHLCLICMHPLWRQAHLARVDLTMKLYPLPS